MAAPALRFKAQTNVDFYRVLRQRVNDYFKQSNKSTFANGEMIAKTIFLVALWAGSYLFLVLGTYPLWASYLIWGTLGFSLALVTVNIGHDAIHGAYSKKKWLTNLLSHSFNLNGASAYMWNKMHNQAHHTYTNIHGYDEDISPIPIIRLSPQAELKKIHRFQYIYSFFIYCLATISWVFIKDYVKFFKNEVGNYNRKSHPKKEYFYLFFYKLLNYTIFLVIPLLVLPFAWYHILLGFLLMHAIGGFYLAIVFMMAHAVEEVHFPKEKPVGVIENNWAVHQLHTCANFSTNSWLAGFMTGGLNTQIEHHLFPHICSIHYRDISGIVQHTAAEYNIPYYDIPTFGKAVQSHLRFMKRIGREEDYQPKPTIQKV